LSEPIAAHDGTPARRPTILLVEDQALVALAFEGMLADLGCTVVGPFSMVATALRAARDQPLDGAVLDVNLAGEQSFPVADLLQVRGVPFFFVTGYGSSVLPAAFQRVPSLIKPVRTKDFAALVRTFLKQQPEPRP